MQFLAKLRSGHITNPWHANGVSGIERKARSLKVPTLTKQLGLSRLPIGSRVDRVSATETVDSGSIPGRVKPKTKKLILTAFLLDVQQLKGQCEASTVCGKQVDRWQLDWKIKRSLRCHLTR